MSHRFPHLDTGLTWYELALQKRQIHILSESESKEKQRSCCFFWFLITIHEPRYAVYYVFKSRITQQLFFTPYLHLHHRSLSTPWISSNKMHVLLIIMCYSHLSGWSRLWSTSLHSLKHGTLKTKHCLVHLRILPVQTNKRVRWLDEKKKTRPLWQGWIDIIKVMNETLLSRAGATVAFSLRSEQTRRQ